MAEHPHRASQRPTPGPSPGPSPRPGSAPRSSPRTTRPLLETITESALDEDYLTAARRRAEVADRDADDTDDTGETASDGPRRRGGLALLAAGVLGLLIAVAAVETAQGRGLAESDRASLVAEVQSRRDLLAQQQGRLAELRESTVAETASLADLTDRQRATRQGLDGLRTATGLGAVRGPGVRIEVDQPPGGDPADDITLLFDGLWNAGAEAVAIDDRRITARTRVASTGPALSIDGRSLVPPYTVLAVGDPATLQARFAESSSGSAFATLAATLLFDFEITTVDDLRLPAARLPASPDLGVVGDADDVLPDRSGASEGSDP